MCVCNDTVSFYASHFRFSTHEAMQHNSSGMERRQFLHSFVLAKMKLFYIFLMSVVVQTNFRFCKGRFVEQNPEAVKKKFNKFNILLIYVDDLRPIGDDYNRVSPSPHNKSFYYEYMPNLRKMAASGVDFKNCFAQQALCAPSRNSMLTGRRPDALRLYDFYSYWRSTIANFTTFPQFFKQNGYITFSVGKIFHPGVSSNFTDDYPYSWSHKPYHPPSLKYENTPVCRDPVTIDLQSNLLCPVNVHEQPGKTLPDLETLKEATKILKRRNMSNKPFLLAVGFHKPHIPFRFPEKYLARVPIKRVKPPRFPRQSERMPMVAFHPWTDVRRRHDINRLSIPFPLGVMRKKWSIKLKQHYYAAANYVDNLIGRLMRHVNRENTIVVLTSDHGWSLGENNLWAKYSNFDAALKVPLIFLLPQIDNISRQTTIDSPVELVDIFPTLVELTGGTGNTIPTCKSVDDRSSLCFEGKSLVKYLRLDSCPLEDESSAISQYPRPSDYPQINSDKPRLKEILVMGYSIRTVKYRYTEWVSFNHTTFTSNWNVVHGVELYDHELDAWESYNLHAVEPYKFVEKDLSRLLRSKVINI